MKTKKINAIKSVLTTMIMVMLFIGSACDGQQKNSGMHKGDTSDVRSTIKPPSLDIHAAALMGNLDAIEQHIEVGTDLNAKDMYGSTPLIVAVTFGKHEVARALIEAGVDVNIQNSDGSTSLHTAAFLCRLELVETLLDNGADKGVKNNFGSTALESVQGPFETVKGIYDQFSKDLGPLGLKLDYEHLRVTRPKIAEILQ